MQGLAFSLPCILENLYVKRRERNYVKTELLQSVEEKNGKFVENQSTDLAVLRCENQMQEFQDVRFQTRMGRTLLLPSRSPRPVHMDLQDDNRVLRLSILVPVRRRTVAHLVACILAKYLKR